MALYHKHRPQTFGSIVGQEHIVQTLQNQVARGLVAHAYLFSGPRGVGKTTTARIVAKAINCPERKEGTSEPCDSCSICEEIRGSSSIDVIEMDAASHTGVDNVRENIIDNAQFRPTKSKYKVFIIDEAHMLSVSAFNALLKTLEEPPAYVIFILATTEKHKLPETILSRCQRFDFKKIPYETMKQHLESVAKAEGVKVDKAVVDRLINKSDGCARDAVSLLDQLMATGEKKITSEVAAVLLPTVNAEETLAFVNSLIEKNTAAGLVQINRLVSHGVHLPQFAHDAIELLRVMLVSKANPSAIALGLDLSDKVKKQLSRQQSAISSQQLIDLIDLLIKRRAEIKSAPIPQLPLELAVVEWGEGNAEFRMKNLESTTKIPPPGGEPAYRRGGSEGGVRTKAEAYKKETDRQSPQKTTLSERVKNLVHKEPAFTLDAVKSAWNECIKKLEPLSPSLVFILKMAEVTEVRGNTVNARVEYSFHRDKLKEKTSCEQIEAILGEILGEAVRLEVSLTEAGAAAKDKNELRELAAAFGGEVIS